METLWWLLLFIPSVVLLDNITQPPSLRNLGSGAVNATLKMVQDGGTVKLRCPLEYLHEPQGNISWLFSKCWGSECSSASPRDGVSLCSSSNPCRPVLRMEDLSKDQEGIYYCYMVYPSRQGYSLSTVLLNAYHLVISGGPEEAAWVDMSEGGKVYSGRRVTLDCKVRSLGLIRLRWFRQVPPTPPSRLHITYLNNTYLPIDSAKLEKLNEDTYMSRLTFNNTTQSDSGTYVCGLIGEFGVKYREAHLTVLPSFSPSNEEKTNSSDKWTWEISVLLFILVLVSVLICCFYVAYCCTKLARNSEFRPRHPSPTPTPPHYQAAAFTQPPPNFPLEKRLKDQQNLNKCASSDNTTWINL